MLQHVTLEIRPDHVEPSLEFWALLGFDRVTPPPQLRDRFIWVMRGGTQIHLMPLADPVTTSQGHAAVVVDDYAATRDALADAGFEVRDGSNVWNAPRAFVRDPAGNLIEVMSEPPLPPWPGEDGPGPR
jgi:catechol 2,3-dioxygenase-like lactoylglutathione lyase family enzyme